jgi:hypothetical protein
VLGDVGGTNVRLVLKKLFLSDYNKEGEIIKEGTVDSRTVNSIEEALKNFLAVIFLPYSYIIRIMEEIHLPTPRLLS